MKKKAFTLTEMLIVIVILAIFSGVLFKTYNTISNIAFRVEQQKRVNEELLFVSEVLQNFANRNSIDFEAYENHSISLKDLNGFTFDLYLSGDDGQFRVFSSGDCVEFSQEPDRGNLWSGCALYMENSDGVSTKLTSDSVYFSRAKFKIIPYSDMYYVGDEQCDTNYFACVNDDGFWLFVDIYPKLYSDDNWANDVHLLVQQFFNI